MIEIVGVAGAGKTTLTRVLCRSGRVLEAERFETANWKQRLRNVDYCFVNAIRSFRTLRFLGFDSSPVTLEDVKKILYLRGWHIVLERQKKATDRTLIVDQGPVFCLATLSAFGPASLRAEDCLGWWEGMFQQWAEQLDAIVWLDGPESVLVDRINKRPSRHEIKDVEASTAHQFLSTYRSAYEETISALRRRKAIELVELDTSRQTSESIAAQLSRHWALDEC